MAKYAEVHQNQPPPPPTAPTAPPMGRHIEPLQYKLDNMHIDMNGDRVNAKPIDHRGNANIYNPVLDGIQGGIRPTQSFGLPLKKTSKYSNFRMYEFKMHKLRGRKRDWEMADRTLVDKAESELRARIENTSKGKEGFSHARDFNNAEIAGSKSLKHYQIRQLLQDLQRHDQKFEWHVEFIELLESKFTNDQKFVATKMIVIVSRSDNLKHHLEPAVTFDLNKDVVDLRPHAHRVDSADHHGGGPQHMPHGHENLQARFEYRQAGQVYGQNNYDIHDSRPTPVLHHSPPTPVHHDSRRTPVHRDSRPTPVDHDSRPTPMHQSQDRYEHDEFEETQGSGHNKTGKRGNKSKEKEEIERVVPIVNPRKYDTDSGSSSDSDDISETKTNGTTNTEISNESPSSDKRYYSDEDQEKGNRKRASEGSRQHYRKNPTGYGQETRGRRAKEEMVIKPASSNNRRQSNNSREPSYHRNRPCRPGSELFSEYFRRYDDSPERRRSSTCGQRRLTQSLDAQDEVDVEREERFKVEIENSRLKRRVRQLERREENPREHQRQDRRQRYDDDVRLPR